MFLKVSQNFTGKLLCQSLFLNKVSGLRPTTLLKKRLLHYALTQVLSCKFCEISKNTFFMEHLRWLPLVQIQTWHVVHDSRSLWQVMNVSNLLKMINFWRRCFFNNIIFEVFFSYIVILLNQVGFFSTWVFFLEYSRFTGQQGKGEAISLTPFYHFHPLQRHLDISRAITAESSPLHIASSRTRTGNL